MDFKEECLNDIWRTFQTKVEDLFVAGYNLPQTLHVHAVEDIENRVKNWKGKFVTQNGLVQRAKSEDTDGYVTSPPQLQADSTGDGNISDPDVSLISTPILSGLKDDIRVQVPVASESAERTVKSPTDTNPDVDEAFENVQEEPVDMVEENEENDEVPEPTPIKRKRGRPPGKKRKKPKLTSSHQVEEDMDSSLHDEHNVLSSEKNVQNEEEVKVPTSGTATNVKRGRGRPPGRKNKPKDPNKQTLNPKKNFSCTMCHKKFVDEAKLERHMLVHRKGPIQCPNCPKQFQSYGGFEVHMRLHTGEGLEKCPICNYITGSRGMMKAHINRVHEKVQKHLCDVCGKGFSTAYMMRRHHETVHLKDQFKDSFSCAHCDYKTHSEACLKSHIKYRHTKTPLFMCNLCGMTVKYKHSLMEHQKRHSSKKLFQCSQCQFRGVCEADVRKHIRRHHNQVAKEKCEICGKMFKQKVHLVRHLAVHSGSKDFACSYCSYRCNDKSNLKKHIFHVHKKQERIRPALEKFDKEDPEDEPKVEVEHPRFEPVEIDPIEAPTFQVQIENPRTMLEHDVYETVEVAVSNIPVLVDQTGNELEEIVSSEVQVLTNVPPPNTGWQ